MKNAFYFVWKSPFVLTIFIFVLPIFIFVLAKFIFVLARFIFVLAIFIFVLAIFIFVLTIFIFVMTFWSCRKSGLIRKISLTSKWRHNLVNKQLQYTYCPVFHELKATRQWNLLKLHKTLDYWSKQMIQKMVWDYFLHQILCMISQEKCFSCYILLTDQILLSDCLYVLRYWAVCVFQLSVNQAVTS